MMRIADGDQPATRAQLNEVRSELKADISILKSDVGILKSDVATLKTDVGTLKADVGALKTDGENLNQTVHRIAVDQATMRGEMKEMEQRILSKLTFFRSDLTHSYEESVSKGKKYDEKSFSHGHLIQENQSKILDHERRIKALEDE